jgi:hypothetical protein
MANVTITLTLPEERLDAVYAAASKPADRPAPPSPPPAPARWDTLAPLVVRTLPTCEYRLLRRLAYALGQRVPVAELARDFGLPADTAPERDFAVLKAFCDEQPADRPFPVVAGGEDDAAWYWMPFAAAAGFEAAFDQPDRSLAS